MKYWDLFPFSRITREDKSANRSYLKGETSILKRNSVNRSRFEGKRTNDERKLAFFMLRERISIITTLIFIESSGMLYKIIAFY